MAIKYFWKPALWLVLICYGLFMPAGNLPAKSFFNIPYFDKIVHFSLFFIFTLLLFRPFKKIGVKTYLWTPVTALFLGAILEYFQRIITLSRSSDIFDFAANACGIAAALIVYSLLISGKKPERFL